mgnify:CR=1 FL=1
MRPLGPISFSEDELLPLSALQHLVFCPRQCALIHLEGVWDSNQYTAEGDILHARVHELGCETRGDTRIARNVALRSLRLGLAGVADCVAFTHSGKQIIAAFPVEYKRGRPKLHRADEVQLCAQALCIEEMLHITVPNGALFYGQTRRRLPVEFDAALRSLTHAAAAQLHQLFDSRCTPPAVYDKKCRLCSLINRCLPRVTSGAASARSYLAAARSS